VRSQKRNPTGSLFQPSFDTTHSSFYPNGEQSARDTQRSLLTQSQMNSPRPKFVQDYRLALQALSNTIYQ
jgi:hypothetical protein